LLYTKKLYYPCVTLLSIVIDEISTMSVDLYLEHEKSQKIECFLYLFEFLLFKQVYLLICLQNHQRALNELLRIKKPVNEMNSLIYYILLGLCYGQNFYYDLSIYNLCLAYYMIKPFVEAYRAPDDNNDGEVAKQKLLEFKKKLPESKILI
jgi:hypothetical protein